MAPSSSKHLTRALETQNASHLCSFGIASHAEAGLQVVGTLRSEVAKELGLTPDVQVAPGSGDNQMSALGAGAVHEGTWVMSLGTSGTLFGLSTKPILDPSGAVSPFCDATGSWLPLLCTMNCTTVTEEVSPCAHLLLLCISVQHYDTNRSCLCTMKCIAWEIPFVGWTSLLLKRWAAKRLDLQEHHVPWNTTNA